MHIACFLAEPSRILGSHRSVAWLRREGHFISHSACCASACRSSGDTEGGRAGIGRAPSRSSPAAKVCGSVRYSTSVCSAECGRRPHSARTDVRRRDAAVVAVAHRAVVRELLGADGPARGARTRRAGGRAAESHEDNEEDRADVDRVVHGIIALIGFRAGAAAAESQDAAAAEASSSPALGAPADLARRGAAGRIALRILP